MNKKELTIVIPTYNRLDRLFRQLESISIQGNYDKYHLVLLDNNSDYSLNKELKKSSFEVSFLENIEIIERPINTRIGYNIASPFLYNKSKWLYIMSDDDVSSENFFEIIFFYMQKYPNASLIKFPLGVHNKHEDILIDSIEELQNCYDSKIIFSGEIFYIGNNLINTEKLSNYLGDSFEYCSNLVGFIMPILHQLVAGEANIVLSDKHVQKFVANKSGDSWHGLSSLLKFAQLYDIRWENANASKQVFRMIYNHFNSVEVAKMLLKEKDLKYQRYVYKRLRNTLFDKRMNIHNTLIFNAYDVECFTTIPLITKFVPYLIDIKRAIKERVSFL